MHHAGEILDITKPIICMCHHGIRSMRVASMLGGKGFTVYNLTGGIHEYSAQIDPSIPQY